MYVSHTHKFVYMAPKKTGSTSMRTLLEQEYDAVLWRKYQFRHLEPDPISPDWRSEGPDFKHVCHLPEELADYFIFATVRNPFALEISRFMHDVRHKYIEEDFAAFINQLVGAQELPTLIRKLHQNAEYVPPPGCVKFSLHSVVRLEYLKEDFSKLPFRKQVFHFEHLHKSHGERPVYTAELARIVREEFREDFERFGYDPRSWSSTSNIMVM